MVSPLQVTLRAVPLTHSSANPLTRVPLRVAWWMNQRRLRLRRSLLWLCFPFAQTMEDATSVDSTAADDENDDEEPSDDLDLEGVAHANLWSSMLLDNTNDDDVVETVTAFTTKAVANEDEEDAHAAEGTEDDCEAQPTEL